MTPNKALLDAVVSNSVATTSLAAAFSALLLNDRNLALEQLREAMAELREMSAKLQTAVETEGA